ncbi:hypothetical protein COCNU_scaffold005961G000050 [Cocos nucifera]|nr:hypothetical protein [Cocos nucifera]
MAPHAHLAIYKVCSASGCSGSDILAGLDEAVKDGVDVLSLSLGAASMPFYLDPIAIGAFGATEKGILVTCAGGNSGPIASSVSNEAPWILTVAASSVDRNFRSIVTLGNGEQLYGESLNQPKSFKPSSLPLVYPDDPTCATVDASITGKVVLCDATGNEGDVAAGIKRAGGAAVIFLNDQTAGYSLVLRDNEFPSSKLTFKDASKIKIYVNTTRKPEASITFNGTVLGVSPAPVVAYFSSRGPSLATPGILKPDISGPGLNIMAAWPVQPPLMKKNSTWRKGDLLGGLPRSSIFSHDHPHTCLPRLATKQQSPAIIYNNYLQISTAQSTRSTTSYSPPSSSMATIPVMQAFSTILKALGTPLSSTKVSQTNAQPQQIVVNSIKGRDAETPLRKRSARLRTKKVKALGLVEETLTDRDILFINSLTPTQVTDMGKLCGLLFEGGGHPNPIDKLKLMEIKRCGKAQQPVATAVEG